MNDADKAALLAEIEASRRRLSAAGDRLRAAGDGVKDKLDLPARIAGSFQKHRPAWLGGAALLGFMLSRLPARERKVYVDAETGRRLGIAGKLGTLWTIAKFATSAAKPWLGDLAGSKIAAMVRRFASSKNSGAPQTNHNDQE